VARCTLYQGKTGATVDRLAAHAILPSFPPRYALRCLGQFATSGTFLDITRESRKTEAGRGQTAATSVEWCAGQATDEATRSQMCCGPSVYLHQGMKGGLYLLYLVRNLRSIAP
jgi:hypothetical protein